MTRSMTFTTAKSENLAAYIKVYFFKNNWGAKLIKIPFTKTTSLHTSNFSEFIALIPWTIKKKILHTKSERR